MMIAVLGCLADVERDLIRTRTSEGRNRARERGKHVGRPPKLTPEQQREISIRRRAGESVSDLARSYRVGAASIFAY